MKKREQNYISYGRGYIVEQIVGTKLALLENEGYKVIHDIQTNRGNIDHVVVGHTGVFVIESKSNKNLMLFSKNGQLSATNLAKKFIKQAAGNAFFIHEEILENIGIDIFVNGLVVRPLNENKKIKTLLNNHVIILDGETANNHIKSFNGYLSEEDIKLIYEHLCNLKRKNKLLRFNFIQKKLVAINFL